MADLKALKQLFELHNQHHLLHFYPSLSEGEREELASQLRQIDPERVNFIFKKSILESKKRESGAVKILLEALPSSCIANAQNVSTSDLQAWREVGLNAIENGKIGVILLAGGQGTRLGSSAPKGCFDIGLPSHKSLFQLQAERIIRLQVLAQQRSSMAIQTRLFLGAKKAISIPWYIMTSVWMFKIDVGEGPTRADTESFFLKHNFFGLKRENVVFFEQGVLPALSLDGKIILESASKVSVAPDGNGGVYAALRSSGVLEDMRRRGLEYLHAYCVDNCLVRVADPVFMGYCVAKEASCGAKVVPKANPHEPVGIVGLVDGKFGVLEYSEISKADAERKNDDGSLTFNSGNIANHFYTLSFLEKVCTREFEDQMEYHIAHKKIKFVELSSGKQVVPERPNGVKLELFIFDIFPFIDVPDLASPTSTTPFAVFSVPREEEFSPLKNASGAAADCPETSRRDIYLQGRRFLEKSGARLVLSGSGACEQILNESVAVVEIGPLLSYDGECLELVRGKEIRCPLKASNKEELLAALI